jgi:hypothetical protein
VVSQVARAAGARRGARPSAGGRPGSREAGLLRRHRYQRAAVIVTASTVASIMAKKPLAIHCAAPMASAVPDEPADRLKTIPLISAPTR